MKYAVIKTGGKQYKVSEGDVLEIDRLKAEKDGKVLFDEVLLMVTDSGVKVGRPSIAGEKVEATVVDNIKGDKLRVSKFKSKVRYRKVIGFRASLSRVKIDKIGSSVEAKKSEAKAVVKKTVKKSSK
jgi:large subunit ribosomal protein L21